ncbi:lysylphosphatidylglycerol synthase transmembrane domain-containing protein [Streptantibioticus ferralitis]|uniref:YbhN family protein n=1 Tax=Streptantibioticus ferralitis TaxID=236510 RepID=A0ABT5Z914_9ACTN|nr:YbhN family protein [Streptantibioticus ferralitis]MDF2260259.1 YbhN family protein [Streptantibioticus ferralitis]
MAGKRRAVIAVVAVAAAVLVVVLCVTVPALRRSLATFGHLNWAWLPLALLAESGSMAAFARNQRHLLKIGGASLALRDTVAIAYAGNALSVSLPLVGTGVGTAFTYRQFRRKGADTASISWALTVGGVVSSLSFAALMTIGALLSDSQGAAALGFLAAAANALPMLAILAALRFTPVRRALNRLASALVRLSRRLFQRPRGEAEHAFEDLLTRIGGLKATPRQYGLAFLHAMRNWAADCMCLVCAIAASGGPVPWHGLLLAYCLGVTAGSAGLTPGGVGVVEATLAAALVAAGLPADRAVPAVLLYRLISLWFVIAIGGTIAATTRRRTPPQTRDAQPAHGTAQNPTKQG